jgi:3-polyprenyl-4-hydroxybenzoate decarboxylase
MTNLHKLTLSRTAPAMDLREDHDASGIAIGGKLAIDATKKLPGDGFTRACPPLIKMDATVKAKGQSFSVLDCRREWPANQDG